MSTTMRESSHVSRKYVSHGSGGGGGAISGQGHSGNASGNSLENNLGKVSFSKRICNSIRHFLLGNNVLLAGSSKMNI